MKINELRDKIANAEHSDIEKIIAEVYKQVPRDSLKEVYKELVR